MYFRDAASSSDKLVGSPKQGRHGQAAPTQACTRFSCSDPRNPDILQGAVERHQLTPPLAGAGGDLRSLQDVLMEGVYGSQRDQGQESGDLLC